MGKCSTLFYIVDNTNLPETTDIFSLEDFEEETDQVLSSIFRGIEFEVNENVVNRILESSR